MSNPTWDSQECLSYLGQAGMPILPGQTGMSVLLSHSNSASHNPT
jgi:hypothetical protein